MDIQVRVPDDFKGRVPEQRESPWAMAIREGVCRVLRGTPVPDFSKAIPSDFAAPHFDVTNPKAQALAQKLWQAFLGYMELRRVEGKGTLELSGEGHGPYPLHLLKDQPVDLPGLQKRQRALMFALAESLVQENGAPAPGEFDTERAQFVARQPIGQEFSADEVAAAFLLAFAYPGSEARRVIDESRTQFPEKRSKTPPARAA